METPRLGYRGNIVAGRSALSRNRLPSTSGPLPGLPSHLCVQSLQDIRNIDSDNRQRVPAGADRRWVACPVCCSCEIRPAIAQEAWSRLRVTAAPTSAFPSVRATAPVPPAPPHPLRHVDADPDAHLVLAGEGPVQPATGGGRRVSCAAPGAMLLWSCVRC